MSCESDDTIARVASALACQEATCRAKILSLRAELDEAKRGLEYYKNLAEIAQRRVRSIQIEADYWRREYDAVIGVG